MARGFRRNGERYVARLDEVERSIVVGLMEQVLALVEPPTGAADAGGDEFDSIVADLEDLGGGRAEPSGEPSAEEGGRDPALDRLLPVANRQDERVAAEFRRLTEGGLRSRKAANLRTAISALSQQPDGRLELDHGQATAAVVALTDVRLVLAERLGLHDDEDVRRLEEDAAGLGEEDPLTYALAVYDFLTWLQETLTQALMR